MTLLDDNWLTNKFAYVIVTGSHSDRNLITAFLNSRQNKVKEQKKRRMANKIYVKIFHILSCSKCTITESLNEEGRCQRKSCMRFTIPR